MLAFKQHKKRDPITPPPDHPIGHILGRGWSWRTIERSIPSHFAVRFHRLFDIGAATRARGARSVAKGQILGEFEANFGATPALGVIPRPHPTTGALIALSNHSALCLRPAVSTMGLLPRTTTPLTTVMIALRMLANMDPADVRAETIAVVRRADAILMANV